jgi:hypothetical protein
MLVAIDMLFFCPAQARFSCQVCRKPALVSNDWGLALANR